jgi:hypothetical protein
MQLKRKHDGRITNADIRDPETAIATFTDALPASAQEEIILEHNTGLKLLAAFRENRGVGDVWTIARMVLEMDAIYIEYSSQKYRLDREQRKQAGVVQ